MKTVEGYPDLIKTIEDGEEVEDLSDESDEEVEVRSWFNVNINETCYCCAV